MQDIKTRGINRNFIKYIALIAMTIDHVGLFFIPITSTLGLIFRIIGRLTCPIMCFFLAEGYYYTKSKTDYAIRLFIFAIISQFTYTFALYKSLLRIELFTDLNMIFTLFLAFFILLCHTEIKNKLLKFVSIILLLIISSICDWGIIAPLFVLIFYHYRQDKITQALAFIIISIFAVIFYTVLYSSTWYGQLWQCGLFLFVPFIFLYNNKKGCNHPFHKWVFYIFYPLQFLIFAIINILL